MRPVALPLRLVHNRVFVKLAYHHEEPEPSHAWTWLDTGGGSVLLGQRLARTLDLSVTG